MPHSRAVTSGTAAVHTAVAAIDPEPGDEIITTSITDMGGIAPILYQRRDPDLRRRRSGDPERHARERSRRASRRARARSSRPTSSATPATSIGIKAVADARGIPVIEDCAQAFLATQDGKLVGTIGAIGAFSLQQGKHMTTGEGGIVVTTDPALRALDDALQRQGVGLRRSEARTTTSSRSTTA